MGAFHPVCEVDVDAVFHQCSLDFGFESVRIGPQVRGRRLEFVP